MKKIGILFLIILWLCTGRSPAVPAESESDLSGLHWLKGHWKGQPGKATYSERWQLTSRGTLEGDAAMVNHAGKQVLTEVLRIEKIGSHIVYIAVVNQNHPVLFTLIETTVEDHKPTWVFENKEHDFPQRIIYTREAPDSLLTRVEGVQKGKEDKEEFRLTREK